MKRLYRPESGENISIQPICNRREEKEKRRQPGGGNVSAAKPVFS